MLYYILYESQMIAATEDQISYSQMLSKYSDNILVL